jgi:hypothetical protein
MEDINTTLTALSLTTTDASRATVVNNTMPSDLVIGALHYFIQMERKTNFSFLARYSHQYEHQQELLVVSQADTEDVKAVRKATVRDATTNCNDWYTFTEPLRADGFTRIVAIKTRSESGMPVTVDDLTITEFGRDNKNECEATVWIRDTYCTADDDIWAMRFSNMQYEEQNLWWESTGQAFRFLELPLEMREAIYLQSIGPVIVPDILLLSHGKKRLVLGHGHSLGDSDRLGRRVEPDIQRPNMSLMLVSKQVQTEATQVANRDSYKRFTWLRAPGGRSRSPNDIWLNVLNVAMPVNFLKKLQLEMNATDYLAFSGIRPLPGRPLRKATSFPLSISTLSSLENLDTIDFRFISSEHSLAECPWPGPHACQKKWIDLFFVTAWGALNMLGRSKDVKYTLSGCLKDSTRSYWTGLLHDRRVDHTATIKLFKQNIQATMPDDGSLVCECTNPCVSGRRLFRVEPHEVRLIEGLQAEMDKVYWDFKD